MAFRFAAGLRSASLTPKPSGTCKDKHAKISDTTTVLFLDKLFGHLAPSVPLFNSSPGIFRRRWDALFERLGVPTGESARGITSKCLRGSGATWMYQLSEDIPRIQWRGRWQQRRTLESLEHYLQDVAGQILLSDVAESHRESILLLAKFCLPVLKAAGCTF